MSTHTTGRLAAALVGVVLAVAACGGDDGNDASASPSGPDDAGETGAGRLDGTITVFAAASLTDAFTQAGDAFEDLNPDATVELNFAGSQSLREQILAGAPADVFASANQSNMDQVAEAGEVDGEPRVLARNELEIAVPAGNPGDVESLTDFADAGLLVGLCAPEVPCGAFGREALASAGVTPEPDTEEPDVRSLLTKIEAGELDAGIVYHSDVVAAGDAVEGIPIPDEHNVVADYPIATLAASGEPETAAGFVDFLLSDEGQAILESHGFRPA